MSQSPHKFSLPRLSLNRPVSVIMSLVCLLVVGFISYLRIPMSDFPEGMEIPALFLYVDYPDTPLMEAEQKITQKLEEAVSTLPKLKDINSYTRKDYVFLEIEFVQGANLKSSLAELKDRVDRVRAEMPDYVDDIWIRRWDSNDWPIIWGTISYPDNGLEKAYALISEVAVPAISRIDGVATMEVWGASEKLMLIYFDEEKLVSHRINADQLIRKLRTENFNLSGGYVYDGGKKAIMRSTAKFQNAEEISNLLIKPEIGLRFGDIAEIGFARLSPSRVRQVDQKDSLAFEVMRTSGSNIVQISKDVRAELDRLKSTPAFEGIDFLIPWDQGEQVQSSVNNLKSSAFWGGLFSVCVILFFLREKRMTGIISAAIPLSIMATLIMIYFIGWSLNAATMMGLMLCLGMVVDNAIVIVENIYRKRQGGEGPRDAAINGAGEVGLAITMATLTTVVVFLPMILLSDNEMMGFWMLRIGMPVIVALIASLFISLLIIPLASSRFAKPVKRTDDIKVVRWLRGHYLTVLRWTLNHRFDAAVIAILIFATIQIPMSHMQKTDQNRGDRDSISLRFTLPLGETLSQKTEKINGIEEQILEKKEEYNIAHMRNYIRNDYASVYIYLNYDPNEKWYATTWDSILKGVGLREEKHMSYEDMMKDMQERLEVPPGYRLRIGRQGGGGAQDKRINISLYGEDTQVLVGLAEEAAERLRTIPSIISVDTQMDRGTPEMKVNFDRDKAQQYNLSPETAARTVSYALRGIVLGRVMSESGEREVDIWMLPGLDREPNVTTMMTVGIYNNDGQQVPLESVATISVESELNNIRRTNRQTTITVTAITSSKDAKTTYLSIDEAMRGFEMPQGYRWDKGLRFQRLEQADKSRNFAILLAITFVLLLMGILFESVILPLGVLVSVPFAIWGVQWTLYLTKTPFDIMAAIGSVILIGVVVNNAIVLVDQANRLQQAGIARFEALIQAGRNRFRPIMLTTLTTAFGLMPMALGRAEMAEVATAPLGKTMMGGIVASAFFTLVLVPLSYTVFDDIRNWIRSSFAKFVATKSSDREIFAEQSSKSTP